MPTPGLSRPSGTSTPDPEPVHGVKDTHTHTPRVTPDPSSWIPERVTKALLPITTHGSAYSPPPGMSPPGIKTLSPYTETGWPGKVTTQEGDPEGSPRGGVTPGSDPPPRGPSPRAESSGGRGDLGVHGVPGGCGPPGLSGCCALHTARLLRSF